MINNIKQILSDENKKLSYHKILSLTITIVAIIPLIYIGAFYGKNQEYIFNTLAILCTFIGTLIGGGQLRAATVLKARAKTKEKKEDDKK